VAEIYPPLSSECERTVQCLKFLMVGLLQPNCTSVLQQDSSDRQSDPVNGGIGTFANLDFDITCILQVMSAILNCKVQVKNEMGYQ
jgi:hypothetical protein